MSTTVSPKRIKVDQADEDQPLARFLLLLFRAFENDLITVAAKAGFSDITSSDLQTLHFVRLEGCLATEISRLAGITKQAVGKSVTSLEARGYLTRKENPKDARAKMIVFTPRGRKLLETAVQAINKIEKKYERDLGSRNYATLRASLASLIRLHPLIASFNETSGGD
jgi:DNA-binding MarR family transcriptional regulator